MARFPDSQKGALFGRPHDVRVNRRVWAAQLLGRFSDGGDQARQLTWQAARIGYGLGAT